MELRHLKLIQAVAEAGTLTDGARRLHLSQSALSHQLKNLENELGAPLFGRIRKRMVLTDVGRRVLKSAELVLEELGRLDRDTRSLVAGQTGILRLAATSHACFHWLPAVLKRFRSLHPGIQVEINSAATQDPASFLLRGIIDLAIENIRVNAPQIQYRKLFDDEMFALVHRDHPWAARRYVTAHDFRDEHLVNYDHAIEDVVFFQRVLRPARVMPRSWTKLPMTEAIVEMVRGRMGVAVLGRWSLGPHGEEKDLRLVRVTRRGLKRTWYAAKLKGQPLPVFVEGFIELLATEGG